MTYTTEGFRPMRSQLRMEGGIDTLLASATLNGRSGNFQAADPSGGAIILTLPPEAESSGLMFWISNIGTANNTVGVDIASGAFLALIQNGGGVVVACDGVTWNVFIEGRALPGINVQTLTGSLSISPSSPEYHQLDPGGANRNVILTSASLNKRRSYHFSNFADGAESLAIAGIVTIDQNEAVRIVSDGTNWQHLGVTPIALS